VGLILAFSGAWLLYFRHEYTFPRALLLIPAGAAAIFALNVLRIAALILIGDAGHPDVAVYGFHSQAGWIAFNTVACGLVLLSRRSTWLNGTAAISASSEADNPTATYLMPLLGILAAGALSRAMSGEFEIFYPLRLIVALAILAHYRHKLATIDWRWSWRGPAVGAGIFGIWIVCAHFLLPAAAMPEKLAAMSPAWRGTWIASRVVAAILTVPIAEELAYRGFLMRRLSNPDFESVPFRSVGWLALTVTAIAFGLAHGALWLPGIAAGMAYGLILMRRGNLGEAVAAHVTTNALVAAGVLGADQWQLW
jgi:exosortase E/protease (VPEID-CTERM system)